MHGLRRKFFISTAEAAIRGHFSTNHSLAPSSSTLLLSPSIPAFGHPPTRSKRGRGKGEGHAHDYSTEPPPKTPATRKEIHP